MLKSDVIAHCDLTPNNVIWTNGTSPCIIDWDAAGYTNIQKDIMQTIYAWCFHDNICNFNQIITFLEGYNKAKPLFCKFSFTACAAALSEDIECFSIDIDPDNVDSMLDLIMMKWSSIRKIQKIVQQIITGSMNCNVNH
jgi:thiamine kinase-like enzyme